jgi:hypothetical protein
MGKSNTCSRGARRFFFAAAGCRSEQEVFMPRLRLVFVLPLVLLLAAAAPLSAQRLDDVLAAVPKSGERSQGLLERLPLQKDHACEFHTIACGQTINTNLTTNDCQLDDGTFVAFYLFDGQAGQTVTINMTSNSFDTFLVLLDPTPEAVASDDDGGSGTNSRIVFTLDQTSDQWTIAALSFLTNVTGPYTLSLACSSAPPPPPPPPPPTPGDDFFTDPEYPDFSFRVMIGNEGEEFLAAREDICLEDTVCVSGQVAGRSELFLRILGPRPNGFLWPTLVRFTPSRVKVEIRQESTQQLNTYILDAIPPGTDLLDGLQDRTGFTP